MKWTVVRCNRWKCWLNRFMIVLGVQVQISSEIVTNFSQHHSRNWPIFSTWQPIMASYMRGVWTFKLDETETSSSVILCPHMGWVSMLRFIYGKLVVEGLFSQHNVADGCTKMEAFVTGWLVDQLICVAYGTCSVGWFTGSSEEVYWIPCFSVAAPISSELEQH